MRLLIALFLGMFVYGVLCNFVGAGLIALVAAGFTAWADKRVEHNIKQHNTDPRNAKRPADTPYKLDEHDCQCYSSRF
jgi:hypothetical protein